MIKNRRKISYRIIISLFIALATFITSPLFAANFNYGEALQKAIFFYDIQRLGKITTQTGSLANRVYWRGDSFLKDYALPNAEGPIDLGGGFADAGDNPKFNFPMAYSMTILAWSVIEFNSGYQQSGQLNPMLANLRWGLDYLLKCWDANNGRLYGQVSPDSVSAEHSLLWMPFEVVDQAALDKNLPRYGFYVDVSHPGTDLAAETVAALASGALVFKATDPTYSTKLLNAAKAIYQTLVNVSKKGKYSENLGRFAGGSWKVADVAPFYNSWSGFNDELAWSAMWLYRATDDASYIPNAESSILFGNKVATLSWDDKSYGTYLLMAKFLPDGNSNKAKAMASAEGWLDAWSKGDSNHLFSAGGLAIATALSPWGNARYASTTAFGALIYNKYFSTERYLNFAKTQMDYLLGNNTKRFSYMVGFGENFSKQPHHATAEGRWNGNNDVNYPGDNRHIAYGGLVGGPKDTNDSYTDDRGDYIGNEVALDYNAGWTGALAGLYSLYGGDPLPSNQFPPTRASENPPKNEFFVTGTIQSAQKQTNQSVFQVSLLATNHSAWPARVTDNLKVRYFITIPDRPSGTALPTVKFFSTDARAVTKGPIAYDVSKGIYYIEVWFKDIPIYPGGDDRRVSSQETQIQITYPWAHDFTKDYSYAGLGSQGVMKEVVNVPIYQVNSDGSSTLLYGVEPSSTPQGTLTLNFASNSASACLGVGDTLSLSSGEDLLFTVKNTPLTLSAGSGGPFTTKLSSTTTPISVNGGTCKGALNASSVSVPGSLTLTYTFTATPLPTVGKLRIDPSSTSDTRCSNAQDTLYVDNDAGTNFLVSGGITKTLSTGNHTIRLASANPVPASGGQTGTCSSTLSTSSVNILRDLTSSVEGTWKYEAASQAMSCTITKAEVIQQSDWGVKIVNAFNIEVALKNFPNTDGKTPITVKFVMKNPFVQNFWGNFGITTSSFNGATGDLTGNIWTSSFTLGGFITNNIPLTVGSNPLTSLTVNGITCTR